MKLKKKMFRKSLFKIKKLFDFSEYPIYDLTNKKVLGRRKDEFKGQIVSEFVR